MPYLETPTAEIWYEIDGAGPPMLLIAGLASDVASWTPVRGALAERFTLIMPDNRGAGRTRAKRGLRGLSIDDMANDIAALTDHLAIETCVVVGHSMGAAIAVEAALQRPLQFRKLVLAGAAAPNPRASAAVRSLAEIHARFGGSAEFYRALFPWLFAPAFFTNANMVEAAVAASLAYPYSPTTEMFAAQVEAVLRSTRADAPLNAETLVLAGEMDILFTPNDCRAFAARFPNADFQEIAGAAHSMFWDKPTETAGAIVRFAAP